MISIFNRLSVKEGGGREESQAVREQLGERAGFPDFVSMEVLHSDYIPQLRIMEEYIGEDRPPLFT